MKDLTNRQNPLMPENRSFRTLGTIALACWLAFAILPENARCAAITPFYTQNQSPVALIFGLPAAGDAQILTKGEFGGILSLDAANNFAGDSNTNEKILFDGESYRFNIGIGYGFAKGVEAGIDIPYIGIGGGILDGFINEWHRFFGFPMEGRSDAPKNRLLFSYTKNGQTRLLLNDSASGLGDIRLSGGYQLYNDERPNPRQVALRASVKLPTGSSSDLRGSGSTDFALWLTAADDYKLSLGHFTLFGAAGGMAMTDGEVLKGQQRNFAGFGTLGFGWGPARWIDLKAQLSGHTPFFKGSDLRELRKPPVQIIVGGTLHFSDKTSLDIGVSEDLIRNLSSDLDFHLALRKRF